MHLFEVETEIVVRGKESGAFMRKSDRGTVYYLPSIMVLPLGKETE